jgi:riboflavin synthase
VSPRPAPPAEPVSPTGWGLVDREAGRFGVEISAETATRSALPDLAVGARVNLELPLRVGAALGGPLVQGHTDRIGQVARIDPEQGGARRV